MYVCLAFVVGVKGIQKTLHFTEVLTLYKGCSFVLSECKRSQVQYIPFPDKDSWVEGGI